MDIKQKLVSMMIVYPHFKPTLEEAMITIERQDAEIARLREEVERLKEAENERLQRTYGPFMADKITRLEYQLEEANRKAERNFDCHASPEGDSCNACVTCLLRENDFLENTLLNPGEYIIERGDVTVFDKKHWDLCKIGEIAALKSRAEAAEAKVERVRGATDAAFELGLGVDVLRKTIYQILGDK